MSPLAGWVVTIPSAAVLRAHLSEGLPEAEGESAVPLPRGGVELRLDLWEAPPSFEELRALPLPLIVTWKAAPGESGRERVEYLRTLLRGIGRQLWVDLDSEDAVALRELSLTAPRDGAVRVLLSRHLREPLPDISLVGIGRDLLRPGADAGKLVLADTEGAFLQAVRISERLGREERPCTVFAAGGRGRLSRFAAVARPEGWAYAAAAVGPRVAAGQPTVASIHRRHGGGLPRLGEAGAERDGLHLVVGAEVTRSISPGYHNRGLEGEARSGRWLDLSTGDPGALLADWPASLPPIAGLAVTAPHKVWARSIGLPGSPEEELHPTWNTLRRDGKSWRGWNTDAPALAALLARRGVQRGDGPVLLLGAGGTARAFAPFLAGRGWEVQVLRRGSGPLPPDLQGAGVEEVGAEAIPAAAVIVNTTGEGGLLPWPVERFEGRCAIELVYRSRATEFLRLAASHGAALVPGVEFFAEQARRQARILHGTEEAPEVALARAEEALAEMERDEERETLDA